MGKEELKRDITKYFELNKDENTSINVWDAAKVVLGGSFIEPNAYAEENEGL